MNLSNSLSPTLYTTSLYFVSMYFYICLLTLHVYLKPTQMTFVFHFQACMYFNLDLLNFKIGQQKPHFKMKFMAWRIKNAGPCANTMTTSQVVKIIESN